MRERESVEYVVECVCVYIRKSFCSLFIHN